MPGIWELRRAVAELYNELYRQGQALAVHRAERLHLRRRARLAHPRRRGARRGEPRPLPARLHRVRGAARHLQAVHLDSDPARRRDAATTSASTSCEREITGRGLSALLLSNPVQPDRQGHPGRRARGLGRARRASVGCSLLIDEFYSHYIWTETADGSATGLRGALRGGRGRRPGRAVRRPHQELALSRLAHHLDRRAASR